ncbi:hypothetical protein AC629_10870 [Bradyrhizobium sp. NAS80.1]|uniref:hypothetical protein n=1 Tax=Bradyrhizobium sp. NAS80.1 TaxID=1680159 RepID=UPI00096450FF|nr:hypothetical protein [Bradyrhizobium sp. NAS80.1]OKO88046.1 hypothetical protein AC629_10870 [Bradyrhizobium sp. NAS80.1]
MPAKSNLSPELLKIVQAAPQPSSIAVTYSAARRRFNRASEHHQRICKLSPRGANSLQASYAIVENNCIIATGEIDAVEAWCRDEGVLGPHEFLKEAA